MYVLTAGVCWTGARDTAAPALAVHALPAPRDQRRGVDGDAGSSRLCPATLDRSAARCAADAIRTRNSCGSLLATGRRTAGSFRARRAHVRGRHGPRAAALRLHV